MVLERKVMWLEGMFLRPHHFQQQDRRTESLLISRIAALQPFFWGFSRLELDESALATGKIALTACEGAFSDGLAFSFPGDAAAVEPLELDGDVANAIVYLSTPARVAGVRLGSERGAEGDVLETRFAIETRQVADELDETAPPDLLKLGEPNLRLVIGKRPHGGFEELPIARVREVTPDRRVVLDPDFIPPILSADVSESLTRAVKEIAALFDVRAEGLAGRYSVAGGASVSAQEQFMLLQVCNSRGARLKQICDMRKIHPAELHRDLIEAAAELASFTQPETRRPPAFPAYDHDDLTVVYTPVLEELRRSLGFLGEQKAVPIELTFRRREQIYYNRSINASLFKGARFVLVARAAMLEEDFRNDLPRQVSIGSTTEIMEIIGAAERSVPLRPLSSFPAEIRPLTGWTPFELDQNAEAWTGISGQQSIAIHAQDVFTDLEMTLWAIKD